MLRGEERVGGGSVGGWVMVVVVVRTAGSRLYSVRQGAVFVRCVEFI